MTTALRREGKAVAREINHLVTTNLFITITNANFDREAVIAAIKNTLKAKEEQLRRPDKKDGFPESMERKKIFPQSSNRRKHVLRRKKSKRAISQADLRTNRYLPWQSLS